MEEMEEEFERNINKITCNTSFQSPIQKIYVSTINDYVYYESDKQVDTIMYSNKQVELSSESKLRDSHYRQNSQIINQANPLRASRHRSHQTGPLHGCLREFARGALYEAFFSAQHDYLIGAFHGSGVQQRAG